MLEINVSDDQRKYAYWVASQHNVGKRGRNDGKFNEQYLGKLGEVVMADTLGLPRPTVVKEFDNGIDFIICGRAVDIKTSGRPFRINDFGWCGLMADQYKNPKYLNDTYCFASYDKIDRVMTFCGIILKSNILEDWFIAEGQPRYKKPDSIPSKWDEYQIPIKSMKTFDTRPEFFWSFGQI